MLRWIGSNVATNKKHFCRARKKVSTWTSSLLPVKVQVDIYVPPQRKKEVMYTRQIFALAKREGNTRYSLSPLFFKAKHRRISTTSNEETTNKLSQSDVLENLADCWSILASEWYKDGKLENAATCINEAITLLTQRHTPRIDILRLLVRLTQVRFDQERYDECFELLKRICEIATDFRVDIEELKDSIAGLLYSVGLILLIKDDKECQDKVQYALTKAIELNGTFFENNLKEARQAYSSLRDCWLQKDNVEKAIFYLQKQIDVEKKLFEGTEASNTALSLSFLGDLYMQMQELDKAQGVIEQSLELLKQSQHTPDEVTLRLLIDLGAIHSTRKNSDKVIECFTEAYQLHKILGDEPNKLICKLLVQLGILWKEKGDKEKSKTYLQKALDMNVALLEIDRIQKLTTNHSSPEQQ